MACKVKKSMPIFIDCDEDAPLADNVDLGYIANPYNGVVTNTVGNDAIIPVVNDTNAGLMTPAQKETLDNSITEVNLSYSGSSLNGVVVNSGGTDATIPAVNSVNAGLMTPTQKAKLDNALTDVDLSYTASPSNGVVVNTGGDDATIPVVDSTNAGLMTPTQKTKLDYLYDSAKIAATFSSTGLLTSFSFNHNAGATPTSFVVSAVSSDAQNFAYATAGSTQITVYYNVAPPVGTNNIKFNAIVIK